MPTSSRAGRAMGWKGKGNTQWNDLRPLAQLLRAVSAADSLGKGKGKSSSGGGKGKGKSGNNADAKADGWLCKRKDCAWATSGKENYADRTSCVCCLRQKNEAMNPPADSKVASKGQGKTPPKPADGGQKKPGGSAADATGGPKPDVKPGAADPEDISRAATTWTAT